MSPFFRRRVNIEKVRDILKINAEQVYYETKSYSQFKYELTLRVVEAIMWNEYKLGWEDLPEEEEIEFVTEVSNILEKDIKTLFNRYKKKTNLQEHIIRILREETDELGERTKLEKLIAKQFIKPGPDLENVLLEPDNYYGVVVDIYNTDYGRQCHITVLMKKPFKKEDSDMLHNMIRKGRERVKDMFSNLFKGGITSSVSTIDSYKDHKWFYDERKTK